MATQTRPTQSGGILATFTESPPAVKAVLGGVFVNRIGGFLNIFLVLFMTARGYSAGQAAMTLGVYGAGSVVGVLIGGALADRLGARNATVLSMAGSAVLIASLLYLPNYWLLLVAVALVGAVSQIYRPASATLLSELTGENSQVMIFAMYRFGLNLGTTAAPLIGFALYNLDGQHYDLLLWGEALVALAYAVLALYALPRKSKSAVEAAGTDAQAKADGSYLDILKDRRYLFYLAATLFNGLVYTQYLSTLPLDMKAVGVQLLWYTLAVALNGFIVIAFELLVTKVSQKWPFKLTVGLAYLLVAVGVAAYGLPLGPAVILIGTLIWTLGEIIGGPVVFSYPAMAGPAHLKGRYIGSFQFMFGLGTAIGPMIGGVLFTRLGHAVWPVMAIVELFAVVFGVAGIKARPKSSDASNADEPAAKAAPDSTEPIGATGPG